MLIIVIYLLMKNKYLSLKPAIKTGSISNRFGDIESREVSLNRSVHDFSVNYDSIDKCDILNIHKCLMKKNEIK